jgi:hypothetical protein
MGNDETAVILCVAGLFLFVLFVVEKESGHESLEAPEYFKWPCG